MRELRRSIDLVWISMAEAALRAEGLSPFVLDAAISAAEGSILAFPRRLMIADEEHAAAVAILEALEAALG